MTEFAETAWLTAAVWDWGPYYLTTATAVQDGTWVPGFDYGTMASGMVDIAPFGPSVSADTAALIETRKAEIIAGTFDVLPDPIVDQDGNSIPLGDIFGMSFFVEGVIGTIPAG